MDCSLPGILQARILEWVSKPSSRRSPWPRVWIRNSCVFCIAGRFFSHWATWEACSVACRMLIPWPGIEPRLPAVEAQSPNHWITRELLHSFYCCIIFNSIDIPHFIYLFIIWLFRFWLVWMMLCEHLYTSFFVFICFHLFWLSPGVELLGHMVTLYLTFWGTARLFHSDCTISYSHQPCVRVPAFLLLC